VCSQRPARALRLPTGLGPSFPAEAGNGRETLRPAGGQGKHLRKPGPPGWPKVVLQVVLEVVLESPPQVPP
jgi:hypothetical protein